MNRARCAAIIVGLVSGVLATAVPATAGPAGAAPVRQADRVIVVGLPGLDWSDVDASRTPALARLAAEGAVGSLSVRAASAVTRRYDGWVTFSAGNRARALTAARGDDGPLPPQGQEDLPAPRPGPSPTVVDPAVGPIQSNNDRLSFDTRIGALGTALRGAGLRTAAAGRGGVLGAADESGTVDVHGTAAEVLASDADLVVVEDVSAYVAHGDDELARIDTTVAAAVAARGPRDLLLVLGTSHRRLDPPHLQLVVASGPGFTGGRLRSASTRRAPFVQLIDAAPTVLFALGVDPPDGMVGQRMRPAGGRGADELARLVDHDVAATAHRRYVPPFFFLLVLAQLLLYGYAWWALRGRTDGSRGGIRRLTRQASLAFAAVPAATYLAQLVPWWRHGLGVLLAVVAAFVAATFVLATAGPWRRTVLGPPGAVAAVTALVLAVDLVTGARLQLSSLAGYSPLVAGRFAGVGNVAFAVFATSALLATAAFCEHLRSRATVAVVTLVGVAAVAIDGSPVWGSDFGGVIALVPGFVVLGLLLTGRRVSWRTAVVASVVAVAVVAAFALLDYSRPEEARSHLGRFVGQVRDGGAGTIVKRKAQANVRLLTHSVLTLVVPIAVGFLAFVLLKPWGGLRRALHRTPALRAGLVAVLVMGVVGFAANDSGVAVPALALTLAVPIALTASVRTAEIEAEEGSRGRPDE